MEPNTSTKADSIVRYDRITEKVKERLQNLQSAYGRKLRNATTDNIYIQHARGKEEAYREILMDIEELRSKA